jgi:plasmid stability protein
VSALTIRNLPDEVHDALRRVAAQRHVSVESLARQALSDLARAHEPAGIDFALLHQHRAALGFAEDGPTWGDELDDPALSRRVLGVD